MLTQDIPRPTPNHPASFSVGRWRGENLPRRGAPDTPSDRLGGRDQDAAQLHRVTRSRMFPTRAFSAPPRTRRLYLHFSLSFKMISQLEETFE
jgi:hypothetical protein